MRGITYIILYWIEIVLICVIVELTDWLRLGEHDFSIWIIGFIARLVMYALIALWGFLGLLWVMEKCKIKL